MSHSPTDKTETADREYLEGWGATYELLRQGKSWSGRETHNAFLNLGDGRFADISAVAGLDLPDDGRAVGVVDWDQDGALDLWIANRTGPQLRYLHNRHSDGAPALALRLEGRHGNRDAVGARAELFTSDGKGPRRVEVVTAGNGYLSQSSRWVHFGLAGVTGIDRVEVRWPGGTTETFRELKPGGRYELVEGSGKAVAWTRSTGSTSPAPRPLPDLPSSGKSRTVLAKPLPLYEVAFLDANQKPTSLSPPGRPVLVNLWASWCVPCRGELEAFERAAERFEDQGLRVLAPSVDDPDQRAAADKVLREVGWSLERGYAESSLVDQLSVVQQAVLDQSAGIALPTSFLLDGDLALWAIYRGPVAPERLVADVQAMQAGRHEEALPFSGRWVARPEGRNVEVLANVLRSRGRPELAQRYLESLGGGQGSPAYLRQGLGSSWEDLGRSLSREGRWQEAADALEKGVEVDPANATIRQLLAAALTELGRQPEAIQQLEEARNRNPDDAAVRTDLGLAYARGGRTDDAAREFRAALERSKPKDEAHWLALYNLGVYYGESDRPEQAIPYLERCLDAAPAYFDAWRYLGIVEQRLEHLDRAVEAYEKALEITPDDGRTIFYLGEAYIAQGNREGAAEQLAHMKRLRLPAARRLERDLAALGESGT
ncbi:MAG: tetratricopeptide repeat protein [Acidobacteria bacterium]|nr:tetratricopeptide repeat protein [Acidobacteriota bacterium]